MRTSWAACCFMRAAVGLGALMPEILDSQGADLARRALPDGEQGEGGLVYSHGNW